jgi:hypothetical protein
MNLDLSTADQLAESVEADELVSARPIDRLRAAVRTSQAEVDKLVPVPVPGRSAISLLCRAISPARLAAIQRHHTTKKGVTNGELVARDALIESTISICLDGEPLVVGTRNVLWSDEDIAEAFDADGPNDAIEKCFGSPWRLQNAWNRVYVGTADPDLLDKIIDDADGADDDDDDRPTTGV